MKHRVLVSRWTMHGYQPLSVHPTVRAALAQVKFLNGRVSVLAKYPDKDTYAVDVVESYE